MKAVIRKSIVILFVVGLLGAMAIPALAANTRTKTITEEQINNSYRVTNPWRRSVSNVSVDLQPGQMVIYSTHTYRGGNSYAVVSTAVPSVENGRIFWDVTSAMVDGSDIAPELLEQINAHMDASWRNYFRSQNPGRVTAVEITDDAILVTVTTGR
jgi:hypothetical protein